MAESEKKMKEIIDIVHKSIYSFFDVCEDGEEEPLSDKDKLLLSVNKAICNNLKALKQETCEDCISREAVLAMSDFIGKGPTYSDPYAKLEEVVYVEDIQALPSVTPAEKSGHWFIDERPESDREVICSNCEQPIFKYHKLDFDYRPRFCPNCGAKMNDLQKEEE